jgi:3',5'-cyclic AMP phosphodiesterase CpdA
MSNYLLTKSFVSTDRHLGGKLNYYYVDDDDYRVRYICLDPFVVGANGTSSTMEFDALQLKWFIDALSDTPYDCVILTHCPLCDSANDRNGDAIEVAGYPTNLHIAQAIMQSYQNKGTVDYTVDGVRVTGDFTDTTHKILCALCGHVHAEGSSFQYGVRHYVADAYLENRTFTSTFIAIDRDSNLLRVLKFDNTQNYVEWDLSLNS